MSECTSAVSKTVCNESPKLLVTECVVPRGGSTHMGYPWGAELLQLRVASHTLRFLLSSSVLISSGCTELI